MCNLIILNFLVCIIKIIIFILQYQSNTFIDFIPKYKNNNNDLQNKLNNEILKNNKLEEENKKLKEELNNNKIVIDKLKIELEKYKNDNQKLKDDLFKSNKIISGIQNNQMGGNDLKKLKDEIINLKYQLNLKDNQIKNLKNINIQNNIKDEPKYNINDIIVINFNSAEVNYGIKCLANETFAEVEEKLYKRYDNLRETNNMFTCNAKPILRFKKICENNIKDGDIIQLFKLE